MFTSLFAPEVQAVLDNAESAAGQASGPFPSPADWRDQVVYFLMVDRFNNPANPPVHQPYDDPNYAQYQYGKFSGVQQQLAYIKSLGAGAIWLSPVLKNLPFDLGSYHGYGIHDFLRAEPYFATNPANADDELRALVDAAHQAGLYVIFDIVLNHIGDAFAYNGNSTAPFSSVPMPIQWRDASGTAQPQWNDIAAIQNPPIDGVVWPSELHQNQYFRRQGMPDPNGADTVGDFDSLKQMMTVDPDLQGFLIRAYQYVIARYDIDGFRIDTLRYLQGNLAQLFGNSVREFALSIGKKNFPGARQLVCRFRDQAALRTGSGNARSGRAPSRRQASSSPFRRAASSAAKASTPCGDQLIPWCLQRADTAQSLYFSTRVLAIHNPARCRCW